MKVIVAWVVCILLVGLVAVGTFRAVSFVAPPKKRQMRQEGTRKMASGDYVGAVGSFDATLEKSGKRSKGSSSDALMYRAEAEYKPRDYEVSIHIYGLLLEMELSTASYLYAQSMYYSQMGDMESAVAKYQTRATLGKDAKASVGEMEAPVAAGGAYVDAEGYEEAMGFY